MSNHQTFTDPGAGTWLGIDFLPGVELMPLAQPGPDGSIHRARLAAGTVIPVHTHPADEFVLVLSGTIETGGRRCEAGTFWTTPAGTRAKVRTSPSATPNCSPCGLGRWGRSATAADRQRLSHTTTCLAASRASPFEAYDRPE
jgi:hypothetical protein